MNLTPITQVSPTYDQPVANCALNGQPYVKSFPNYLWLTHKWSAGTLVAPSPTIRLALKRSLRSLHFAGHPSKHVLKSLDLRFAKRGTGSLALQSLKLRSKQRNPLPTFVSLTPLHTNPIWTLHYLNSLRKLYLLGLPPTQDYYSFEKGAKWSESSSTLPLRVPTQQLDQAELVNLLGSLVNSRLKNFFTFASVRKWQLEEDSNESLDYESENSAPLRGLSYLKGKCVRGPQVRTKFRVQPYTFLGVKTALSSTAHPDFINLRAYLRLRKFSPKVTSSLITRLNSPHYYFKKFSKSTKAWSFWVKRSLNSHSIKTTRATFCSIMTPSRTTSLKVDALNSTSLAHLTPFRVRAFTSVDNSLRTLGKYAPTNPLHGTCPSFLKGRVRRFPTLPLSPSERRVSLTRSAYVQKMRYLARLQSYAMVDALRTKLQKRLRRALFNRLISAMRFVRPYRFKRRDSGSVLRKFVRVNRLRGISTNSMACALGTPLESRNFSSIPRFRWAKLRLSRLKLKVIPLSPVLRSNGVSSCSKRLGQLSLLAQTPLSPHLAASATTTVIVKNHLRPYLRVNSATFTLPQMVSTGELSNLNTIGLPCLHVQRVLIYPNYSQHFSRSPFFFVNRSVLRSRLTDLMVNIKKLRPSPKYLVFPDANDLKTSIFRRLHRQKIIFNNRFLVASSKRALDHPNSLFRAFKSSVSPNTESVGQGTTAAQFAGLATGSIALSNLFAHHTNGVFREPRIRRIRFKPGYGRIWRAGRRSIRDILGLHHRYQYRLSPKLQLLYFSYRRTNIKAPDSTTNLGTALMTCRFAPDIWTVKGLLTSGSVFLNGVTSSNPETRLFMNDFIQLIVHIKFYIAFKWIQNFSTVRKNKVNKIFYRKFRPSTRDKTVKVVRTLPTWFYDLQYAFSDIPRFFEVDYFTLSVFMIHSDLTLENWMPSRARLFDPLILNMYNWKYIT